jgi:hypothetical protein
MSPARHAPDDQLDAATWCRHLVLDGSVYAFLADHRHDLFPPETFADLVRQGQGHPSVPAEVVGSVGNGATRVLPAGPSLRREALDTWLAVVDAWVASQAVASPAS